MVICIHAVYKLNCQCAFIRYWTRFFFSFIIKNICDIHWNMSRMMMGEELKICKIRWYVINGNNVWIRLLTDVFLCKYSKNLRIYRIKIETFKKNCKHLKSITSFKKNNVAVKRCFSTSHLLQNLVENHPKEVESLSAILKKIATDNCIFNFCK